MNRALRLARRGLGRVAPNPAVGCVIVRDGQVIGEGRTQNGGRPHAETVAIDMALVEQSKEIKTLKGATAYVTLEPCAHHGKTGPCAEALIESGISKVVVAMRDPDPRVSGRGLARLSEAGIEVVTDVCSGMARELNAGFILKVTQGRPLVTLKLAVSQNGMMRRPANEDPAITSVQAQRRMHLIRAEHDAILVGAGTFKNDHPSLTCRLPGMAADSPDPFVASRSLDKSDLPEHWNLLQHAHPSEMLEVLAEAGVTRLMLEGGPKLAKAFLSANLVDRLAIFQAPFDLTFLPQTGADAPISPIAPMQSDLQYMGIENLPNSPSYTHIRTEICGPDVVKFFQRI